TPTKRALIPRMYEKERMTFAEIGAEFNMTRQTVASNYRSMKATEDAYLPVKQNKKRGRRRRFNGEEVQAMIKSVDTGQARDAVDVRNQLFPQAPIRTVQHTLSENDRRGFIRRRKPYLS
ncbi:hypothetical protein K525DRAFT_179714, partial [Schizophyllum commune Loenen D]